MLTWFLVILCFYKPLSFLIKNIAFFSVHKNGISHSPSAYLGRCTRSNEFNFIYLIFFPSSQTISNGINRPSVLKVATTSIYTFLYFIPILLLYVSKDWSYLIIVLLINTAFLIAFFPYRDRIPSTVLSSVSLFINLSVSKNKSNCSGASNKARSIARTVTERIGLCQR